MSVRACWAFVLSIQAALLALPAVAQETPVERGAYLVNTVMTCQNCHTPMGPDGPMMDKALSGGLTFDEPPFKVTASNITQDKATGIGNWSDAEIETLLRTGVRPDGIPVAPIMPTGFYGIITDSDMKAIIAYLRTVEPIENKVPDPIYRMALPHQVFPGAEKPWADPGKTEVERGFYLATVGHCMECHTPLSPAGREFSTRLGVGGEKFPGPWGESISANITSDPEHGLGKWTNAEIKQAITKGIARDGQKLKPPMGFGFYDRMTEGDLDALVAYLRTVPPLQ